MFNTTIIKSARTLRTLALTTTIMASLSLATAVAPSYAATSDATTTGGMLQGHLRFEGQPPVSQGGPQRDLEVVLSQDRAVVQDFHQMTDGNGSFTVDMGNLASGVYQVWVKSPRFLAAQAQITYNGTPMAVEIGTLLAGDANNNNVVTIVDFTIVRNTLGKALGDSGYDARADFNYDDRVNIVDFNLMRNKIGLGGAPHP